MEDKRPDDHDKKVSRGRRNRQRGQEHERAIETTLVACGFDARKTREYTSKSAKLWDVEFKVDGDARVFRIQCKRRKAKGILAQAAREIKSGGVDWYSFWPDGNPKLAVLSWDEFIMYFQAWTEKIKRKENVDRSLQHCGTCNRVDCLCPFDNKQKGGPGDGNV